MSAIDDLVREGLERGLKDQCQVLYISPLKALSNDMQKNLQAPPGRHPQRTLRQGLPDVEIRAWVRTGDTPQAERDRMRRKPPHIVVTTPESLYILLTSDSGRKLLSTVRTVIVDEIHALAGNKRGAHLALSLERLAALTPQAAGAHRPVGDPEAHRRSGAFPHRRKCETAISSTPGMCVNAACIWRCRVRRWHR